MTHPRWRSVIAAGCCVLACVASAPAEDIGFLMDEALGTASGVADDQAWPAEGVADQLRLDPAIMPTQLTTGGRPTRNTGAAPGALAGPSRRTPARNAQLTSGAVSLGLASIPFMIGDTGAGTCLAFRGIVEYEASHPTLSCSRLNIAENNTAIPVDRAYFSYRHFHNAARVKLFRFTDEFDIDRFTLGFERTCLDGMASVEMRMPLSARLRSDFFSAIVVPGPGPEGVADLVIPADGSDNDTQLEAGNLSIITKMKLIERDRFVLSGGLGVTVPTAQDVNIGLIIQGFPRVTFDNFPGIEAETAGDARFQFDNETIYLSPFLAWAYAGDNGKWFHQGFLQVEAAANTSSFVPTGGFDNIFYDPAAPAVPIGVATYLAEPGFVGELHSQTIMRLNLGLGRVLLDRPRALWLQRVNGLAELHYTTTLQDAKVTDIPLISPVNAGVTLPQDLDVGNLANRVDILNAALGVSAEVRAWTITNGFVAPLRDDPDRGFDFEYNLQAQRVF